MVVRPRLEADVDVDRNALNGIAEWLISELTVCRVFRVLRPAVHISAHFEQSHLSPTGYSSPTI